MNVIPNTLELVNGKLMAGTGYLLMDEPCFSLKEVNLRTPDSKGIHRYMVVTVVRNDKIAEHRRDLGPASAFTMEEFVIPGGIRDSLTKRIFIEETVGRLMQIADELRAEVHGRPDPPKGHDLVGGYFDSFDKTARRRKGQSTFGYGATTQRG